MKHTICKRGAAVRLHGYMPATVLRVYHSDDEGATVAECRVTVKRAGIGPHGYKPGEIVTVRACHAVPRDCVYIKRGTHGRICWHSFAHEITPEPATVTVLSIDAWREGGSWTWNAWYKAGTAPLAWCDLSPRALFRRMREAGYLSDSSAGKVAREDDGHNVVILDKGTREPLLALEYGSLQE